MSSASPLRSGWQRLTGREQAMVAAAAALVGGALLWWLALAPALATLRTADEQHRMLDGRLQRMLALQAQAQAMQSQPRQNHDEALRQLETSVRQSLGTSARMVINGERVTLTLTATPADALAQWLTQARINARALPAEARLTRNGAAAWDGTVALTLPPR